MSIRASQPMQQGHNLQPTGAHPTHQTYQAAISTLPGNPPRTSRETRAQRFEEALVETVRVLTDTISEKMPHGAYRDYYLWALSEENDERDLWLQVIGARQIVQLVVELMSDFLDDEQW